MSQKTNRPVRWVRVKRRGKSSPRKPRGFVAGQTLLEARPNKAANVFAHCKRTVSGPPTRGRLLERASDSIARRMIALRQNPAYRPSDFIIRKGAPMKNIILKENHTFHLFKEYYDNIRKVVTKNDKGSFVDPFDNVIRGFKMDELGNLKGVYIRLDYGDTGVVLFGDPDGRFEVQGNENRDMYAYVFDKGILVEERKSNEYGYFQRKYNPTSEGRPVYEMMVHHGGPFQKKQWTEDGKTLIHKEVHVMDKDCLEKQTREFMDKDGQWHKRIDWKDKGRWVQSEMYLQNGEDPEVLQWLCEVDHKHQMIIYRPEGDKEELRVTDIVTDVNGKRKRIDMSRFKSVQNHDR